MNNADKKRLKDAFLEAIEKSPEADTPISGMMTPEGGQVTMRMLFTNLANDPKFYVHVDEQIKNGNENLDSLVEKIRTAKTIKPSK